jgi:N-sulfoglucosamine sulfohydrolase
MRMAVQVFVGLCVATFTARCAAAPNIVVFISDDHSYRDSSLGESPDAPTPNLARLAAAGMTFPRTFVVSPSCAPSRAALLTGRLPVTTGAMFNHQPPRPEFKRLPAYLKELGYEVVAFGKVAHYDQVRDYGFDLAEHFTYHDDVCVAEAIAWLERRQNDQPLCLMVGTNWPHVPWPAKEAATDPAAVTLPTPSVDTPRSRNIWSRYQAAVKRMDDDLGAVYDAAYAKLGQDTLFIHFSDHGAQWPFGKWNLYDAGLQVPLVVAWPGKIAPGSECTDLTTLLDVLPTMIEASGGQPPADLAGRSFLPVLTGQADRQEPRDAVFATHSGDGRMNEYPMRAVRTERWKYIRNLRPDAEFTTHDTQQRVAGRRFWETWLRKAETDDAAAAIVARHRFRPAEELYDLEADPFELHNLAADPAQAATLVELRGQLDGWMAANSDRGLETEATVKPPAAPAAAPARQGAGAGSR